ncbi:hypothetical protein BGZ75_004025 [Mortierella antarctica]|nr:hypothetical protein BGZ75_004025 [Mortierella antarctica]
MAEVAPGTSFSDDYYNFYFSYRYSSNSNNNSNTNTISNGESNNNRGDSTRRAGGSLAGPPQLGAVAMVSMDKDRASGRRLSEKQSHLGIPFQLHSSPLNHPDVSTPSAMVQHVAYGSFLLFGDSITQYSFDVAERGFGAQLAHLFQRRLDVINRGFSGYTTEQAIHLLPQFLPRCSQQHQLQNNGSQQQQQEESQSSLGKSKIEFLTLFFGANDACLASSPQHVDLERYERNLRALMDMIHSPGSPTYSPETRIIVICPPPIDQIRCALRRSQRGMKLDRDTDVTRRYAETCLRVAKEYQGRNHNGEQVSQGQVDVIDTWNIMMDQVKAGRHTLDEYLKDGLHLASQGNDVIFEEIMKIIRSRYPEWDPETMPMHAPWWGDLDPNNPEKDLLICGNKDRH